MSRRRKATPEHLDPTRREFLWKGACAALSATGIASTIWDLRLINAAAAQSATQPSYKALVCIFLFGGNDANNMVIPTDATYASNYVPARGVLAIPAVGQPSGVIQLVPPAGNPAVNLGLHPSMPLLSNLFTGGQLALLCNVGTLLAPLSRTQYLNHSVAVPPQLFSHNDQQVEWQTSVEDQPPKTGWGGRSADLLYSLNNNNAVSMNISLSGANTFQVGNVINEYNVSTNGAISLNISGSAPGPAQLQALKDLIAMNHNNLYESAFATELNTAITDAQSLNNAIAATAPAPAPVNWVWNTAFPNTSLGNQLKMIARLIQAAPALGHNRQIFFASTGGFDLHSGQGAQTGAHANLLTDLNNCMNALYQATVQLGVQTSVTQFTASDFCRTFPVNTGLGSDHGWGNHQLILGGGVQGGKIYGTYPTLSVNGPDDTSTGRWIPTTSVDQYSATLAKWFGVSAGNMATVFPYIGRFATADLGFMGP
jgi:uncharacterized protein (DUF1501 family)